MKIKGIKNKKDEVWKFVTEKHLLSNYGRWYSISWKRIMKQLDKNIKQMWADK